MIYQPRVARLSHLMHPSLFCIVSYGRLSEMKSVFRELQLPGEARADESEGYFKLFFCGPTDRVWIECLLPEFSTYI